MKKLLFCLLVCSYAHAAELLPMQGFAQKIMQICFKCCQLEQWIQCADPGDSPEPEPEAPPARPLLPQISRQRTPRTPKSPTVFTFDPRQLPHERHERHDLGQRPGPQPGDRPHTCR